MKEMSNQLTKGYAPPMLSQVGSVELLTHGNKSGSATDKAFPVHTPKASFTFS